MKNKQGRDKRKEGRETRKRGRARRGIMHNTYTQEEEGKEEDGRMKSGNMTPHWPLLGMVCRGHR